MLDSLRRAAGTWIAKLLLVILVISFAVWGISGQIASGLGGNTVLTTGGTSVSVIEYRLAYDREMSVLSQQFGVRLTREQAQALGIDQRVLAQLIAGALLDEQARQMGLGVSRVKLAELTAADPAFQGPDGRFSRQQFDYVLRQIGMRPEDYFRNREQVAIRQQIVEAVSDGLKVPDTFLHAVALYRGEDRTVEYVGLPKSLVEPVAAPEETALTSWFEERKADYAAPEYRKISYIKLEPEDIADTSAISDEQVRDDYEKNIARYTTPEMRTIEQIVFKTAEAAKAAYEAIRAGSTFEDIVEAEGKTLADVQLGSFTKDRVPDQSVAEVAFGLSANQVSEVIEGAFGPVIVRVTEIKPEVVKPFDEVKEDIRTDLALNEAGGLIQDVHDGYEDARAGGLSFQQAAETLKLKVVTVEAIDRAALRPDGTVVSDLPQSQELLRRAFESEVGIENPPLNIGSSGYLFYEVDGITPARDRTLDEVRDKVVADWIVAETATRLDAKGAELEKRLKDGTTLDAIATELGYEKQVKRGVKREADDADFGREGVATIFDVAEGGIVRFVAPSADQQFLAVVTEVFEPAGAGPEAVPDETKTAFASGLSDDLLDQLVAKLESEYGVQINQAAIQQALAF